MNDINSTNSQDAPTDKVNGTVKDKVSSFIQDGIDQVAKAAKENPKIAMAAGATVIAGAVAAAAIPILRASKENKPASKTPASKK